jgi:hypothetical protein
MSVLKNVNYMKRFVHYPCAAPNPLILIETGLEAFLPVMIELFSFQVAQLAMRMPKLVGAQKAPGLPAYTGAPGAQAGGRPKHGVSLQGISKKGGRSFGERLGPNTFIFRLSDLEQTGLYYWMIADLATQFLARWTSLIYMHERCKFGGQCYKEGEMTSLYVGPGVSPCFLPQLNAGRIFSGGLNIQVSERLGGHFQQDDISIAFSGKLNVFNGGGRAPSGASLQLLDAQTGEVLASGSGEGQVNSLGMRSSGGFYTSPRGSAARGYNVCIVNHSNDTVGVVDGKLMIAGGFCVSSAPAIPFDASHLAGRIDPRPTRRP